MLKHVILVIVWIGPYRDAFHFCHSFKHAFKHLILAAGQWPARHRIFTKKEIIFLVIFVWVCVPSPDAQWNIKLDHSLYIFVSSMENIYCLLSTVNAPQLIVFDFDIFEGRGFKLFATNTLWGKKFQVTEITNKTLQLKLAPPWAT